MALGDRGSAVKAEQERLNGLGADLVVDGIWGPKTQAAFVQYGAADGGSSTANGSKLLLPGEAQLWHNSSSGEDYVVYEVPGVPGPDGKVSEPVYTAWLIESPKDLEAVVGPGKKAVPSFTGAEKDFTDKGVIHLGGVDELRVSDLEGDPFDNWVEDMTKLAAVQPWILDDDYIGLVVQAAMERVDGRISLEEIQSTKWWKEHNAGERAWMETSYGDPETADQILADNRASLKYRLANAGVANPPESLVNWMADRTTTGAWSSSKLDSQIMAVADPYSVDVIDDDLFEFMATNSLELDHTRDKEDRVRVLVNEWLGPVFGNWSDEDVARKAGELRNDPDAEMAFIESLKDQRVAAYPEHGDRNLSYSSIAQPWKTYTQSVWGAPVEDTDEVFQQVIRANDPREAGKLLRTAGIERGYEKTVKDVADGIHRGMKGNVRGAV